MTPLARFYGRFLPRRMVWLALGFSYGLAIVAVVVFGGSAGEIIYIDIGFGK